jgi:hypothetical protein
MTKASFKDLQERLDALEVIYKNVIELDNDALSDRLMRYRSDNVQWVLNMLEESFRQLLEALETEEANYQ